MLLVGFVFTTCNGSCPATTSRMVQVQQKLRDKALLKEDRVRLLTISLDPVRDTPEARVSLCETLRRGPVALELPDAAATRGKSAFRLGHVDEAGGEWANRSSFGVFLVDGKGRIREIYDLAFLKALWVVEDIETILAEAR